MNGPPPANVLMLSAVGTRLGGPDTGEEQRQVAQVVRSARYRDGLAVHTAQAVRGEDILEHLLERAPTVVHFSGHATDDGLRVLTTDGGDAPLVTAGLGDLLAAAGKGVRLVLLNACATNGAAEELARTAGCAIGYPGRVQDVMAITFAREFYRCVGAGLAVGPAHSAAVAVTVMYGAGAGERAVLHHAPGVDPETWHLLHPAHMVPLPGAGNVPDPTAFLAQRAGAKPFIALVTGTTNSEARLRSTLASTGDLEVQWIRIDDDTSTDRRD
ncbi:CHAT domain-containing protein [Streptomyces sp. NPDC098789]|uniref:CHAT domain-containing protein n=1 Tax=Streptomyces sp. NPDC098789 TaxID=3366098 RepID=UPI003823A878